MGKNASFTVSEPVSAEEFMDLLRELRAERRARKRQNSKNGKRRRDSFSQDERDAILSKTRKLCHICGGAVDGHWQADHVLAFSGGGKHSPENYLPAHPLCNNYRWDYLAEEFQYILKLGVWVRTKIEKGKGKWPEIAKQFMGYEKHRRERQKAKRSIAQAAG